MRQIPKSHNGLKFEENFTLIKILIWAYFALLLTEGALRKWFLPGLSQGLLIIRDPIVIWIYYLCYAQGIFPLNNNYLQIFAIPRKIR